MRISINLATRPFTDYGPILRQLRIAIGVMALLVLGFWIGLHFTHAAADKAREREHKLDMDLAKLTKERNGYEAMMTQPDNALVLKQSKSLNKLFDEKTFSWTLAMEDLESVLPAGVQVTTLEPERDEKTQEITVKLRVSGPRDKSIDLVKNLEHSKRFKNARIIGETVEAGNTATERMQPVSATNRANFDLKAEYRVPDETEIKEIVKKQKKEGVSSPVASAPLAPVRTHVEQVQPLRQNPVVRPPAVQPENLPRRVQPREDDPNQSPLRPVRRFPLNQPGQPGQQIQRPGQPIQPPQQPSPDQNNPGGAA